MAWRQVQARFGPDVQWVDHIDYAVDESRKAAIRRYWAHLPDGTLQPAYCGVRPKTVGPSGQKPGDFTYKVEPRPRFDGYVALYGIESPSLTASLALADHVTRLVLG